VAACDYAVAVRSAVFAFSEVKLGLIPATISPHVVRAIGPRNAKMLFVTGRRFSAEEAMRVGLVQALVEDPAGFEPILAALAADLSTSAPQASALAKALVDDVLARPLDHALLEFTARAIAERRASAEGREGVGAFLERRSPEWTQ
jgi:methylglutaconyl-CoA hydratase